MDETKPIPPADGGSVRVWNTKRPLVIGVLILIVLLALAYAMRQAMREKMEQPANSDIVTLDPSQMEKGVSSIVEDDVSPSSVGSDPSSEETSMPPERSPSASAQKATLTSGRSVTYSGVIITPVKILSDSRCPVDVQCVWEGELIAEVEVGSNVFQMKMGRPITTEGITVNLIGVSPEKRQGVMVDPSEYSYMFEMSK